MFMHTVGLDHQSRLLFSCALDKHVLNMGFCMILGKACHLGWEKRRLGVGIIRLLWTDNALRGWFVKILWTNILRGWIVKIVWTNALTKGLT